MVILALLLMWKWRASLIQTASAAYVAVTGEVAPWLKNGDTDIATIVLSPDSVPAEEVPSLSGSKYAYSTLSEDGKLVYDQVYDAIMNRKTDVSVSTLDAAVLEQAYNCVMADYGGLFWVYGYTYNTYSRGDKITSLTFSPSFTMTEEEQAKYQAQIDHVVENYLSGISLEATDYQKAKYVFETLIKNVEYDTAIENNQNILSAFLGGATVCQGYSDAASYLLSELGIQSTVVTGVADGESHAWNLLLLDGKYYYMDVTWGNSRYLDHNQNEAKRVNYVYLNTDSKTLMRNHTANDYFPLPECDSIQDSYFVQEGLYFTGFDGNAIGNAIASRYGQGETMVSIRFDKEEDYLSAVSFFIDDSHIRDYVGQESISYITQDEDCILTFKF